MSDDRYKQSPPPFDDGSGSGGDFDEDEKTQLVDLESLQSGGDEPQFAPPPTMDSGPPVDMGSGAGDDATQLFEIPSSMDQGDDGITSSAPDFDSSPPPTPGGGGVGGGVGGGQGDQMIIGDGNDYSQDEATQFVNINDFAQEPAHFTPEQEAAGYDGNTQFVDVNALMAGGGPGAQGAPIDNDRELHRGYQFEAGDIQHGDITLIFAENQLGKSVVLKRVWEDDPQAMTTPLRQRIAQLHELKHPNLLAMNGMFVTDSGMWVELDAPPGQRLTALIEGRGPQPAESVLKWLEQIADVLQTIHSNQLAYANLTTDSVWIDGEGNAKIEPFDMLRFEDRGNLGAFGPAEMDAPPERRQLSPATDVYSLAAVGTAALMGLPLRANGAAELEDKKLSAALTKGMSPNPGERQQSAEDFVDDLQGGGLDIKIVGGGAAAVMILLVVVLSVLTGGDDGGDDAQNQDGQAGQAQAVAQEESAGDGDSRDDGESQQQSGEDGEGQVAQDISLPADVSTDERLTIRTSLQLNPPDRDNQIATDEQLTTWREEAADLIGEAEDQSSRNDKYDHYASALERLAYVVRSQEDPSPQDLQAWREIYELEVVEDQVDEIYKAFTDPLLEGRLDTAARRYGRIARINPAANAGDFLSSNRSAEIVALGDGHTEEEDDDE